MLRDIGWHFARISVGALILVVLLYDPEPSLYQRQADAPIGQPSIAYAVGGNQTQLAPAVHNQLEEQERRDEKQNNCNWSGPLGPCIVGWLDQHNGTVTALATIVIAAFTISLAFSTRRLWQAGEDQIKVARESADAAKASIEAMREANRIARESDRAWIGIIGIGQARNENPWAGSIEVKIGNSGKTPALDLVSRVYVEMVPHGRQSTFIFSDQSENVPLGVITPGGIGDARGEFPLESKSRVTRMLANNEATLWVHFKFTYRSVADADPRETTGVGTFNRGINAFASVRANAT